MSAIADVEERLAELRGGERGQARTQLLDLVVLAEDPREADRMARLLEELPGNRPSRAIIALAARRAAHARRERGGRHDRVAERRRRRAALRARAPRRGRRRRGAAEPDREPPAARPARVPAAAPRSRALGAAGRRPAGRSPRASSSTRPASARASTRCPALLAREPKRSVTDLSWSKLTGWRELVARLFDPPRATRALGKLDRIELTHAGRSTAQARLLAAWVLSRTGRHPSVELTSESRRDMRSGSLIRVVLTCGKERYEVVRLAEGVAEVRSPYLEPQQARLWVPHLPALVAEELGIYERDEGFEAAVAQLAT